MRFKKLLSFLILSIVLTGSLFPVSAFTVFKDVSPAHWGYEAIRWGAANKIIDGYEDRTFKPDKNVTQAEFLTMLVKAYKPLDLPAVSQNSAWDEQIWRYAAKMNWELSVARGVNVNRGHAALILISAAGKNLSLEDAIQYMLDTELSSGKTSATIGGYKQNDGLTRAEALKFVYTFKSKIARLNARPKTATDYISPGGNSETLPKRNDSEFILQGISVGDPESKVLEQLGPPARKDLSEYGFQWYIYNQDYKNYIQVGIHEEQVVGLFTNSKGWASTKGIHVESSKAEVENAYSQPLGSILKGNTIYHLNFGKTPGEEYGTYLIDGVYATFFYDIHNNNTVTAIQLIQQDVELSLKGFYGHPGEKLRESFEKQVFDLANAVRVRMEKAPFVWDDAIADTARKHSKDMMERDFFSHFNPEGRSPFDRMKNDRIQYRSAAENLFAGAPSAIYAHEGWMNSEGHRKNILSDIERLGVGVQFGGRMNVYYTQNFYTGR